MCNLICGVFFALLCVVSELLKNRRGEELFLRVMGGVLFVYKGAFYVSRNLSGTFSVPVEVSAISYFLIPLIMVFRSKKLYNVGAFFGILAGIGYFTFYSICGFLVEDLFSTKQVIIGCFSHGYLFLAGCYLFRNHLFLPGEGYKIWIAVLAMCGWALLFYGSAGSGTVFLYYILRPVFLFAAGGAAKSALLLLGYYGLLAAVFYGATRLFFFFSGRFHRKKTLQCA